MNKRKYYISDSDFVFYEKNEKVHAYNYIKNFCSNIILDDIKWFMYSQIKLNDGFFTIIQLVNYLRLSHLKKNLHTFIKKK